MILYNFKINFTIYFILRFSHEKYPISKKSKYLNINLDDMNVRQIKRIFLP